MNKNKKSNKAKWALEGKKDLIRRIIFHSEAGRIMIPLEIMREIFSDHSFETTGDFDGVYYGKDFRAVSMREFAAALADPRYSLNNN